MSDGLRGRRVLVTRRHEQSLELSRALEAAGAEVTVVPLIEVQRVPPDALKEALTHAMPAEWITFSSANGVEAVLDSGFEPGATRIGAVGEQTALVARSRGLAVSFVPSEQRAEGLAQEMPLLAGERVVCVRGDRGSGVLADGLRERGAVVIEVVAYSTTTRRESELMNSLRERLFDWVILASPSAAEALAALISETQLDPKQVRVACVGPVTASAARGLGFAVAVVANKPAAADLVEAMSQYGGVETRS